MRSVNEPLAGGRRLHKLLDGTGLLTTRNIWGVCSEAEPTTNAHHLHRAPLLPLGCFDAALVEHTGSSPMRKFGQLRERRAQRLCAVERFGLRGRAVVPIAAEFHAASLGGSKRVLRAPRDQTPLPPGDSGSHVDWPATLGR